jgi:predicted  nucleic acid-binding Zn-ribbon protein
MNDTYRAKEQEIKDLKIAYKQKDIALTALTSQHTILQMKSTAQNGADGYAQLQKNFKELQAKLKLKEDESELYEKQCIFLTEAFQLQGMNLPAEVPVDTPAPAPAPAPADPHDPN